MQKEFGKSTHTLETQSIHLRAWSPGSAAEDLEPTTMPHASVHQGPALGRPKVSGRRQKVCARGGRI